MSHHQFRILRKPARVLHPLSSRHPHLPTASTPRRLGLPQHRPGKKKQISANLPKFPNSCLQDFTTNLQWNTAQGVASHPHLLPGIQRSLSPAFLNLRRILRVISSPVVCSRLQEASFPHPATRFTLPWVPKATGPWLRSPIPPGGPRLTCRLQ